MDVKQTVQDNVIVRSIKLDVQSYVDALKIATIELVFSDFYSVVFFSKQWTKFDIFFKKSTNNVTEFIYHSKSLVSTYLLSKECKFNLNLNVVMAISKT